MLRANGGKKKTPHVLQRRPKPICPRGRAKRNDIARFRPVGEPRRDRPRNNTTSKWTRPMARPFLSAKRYRIIIHYATVFAFRGNARTVLHPYAFQTRTQPCADELERFERFVFNTRPGPYVFFCRPWTTTASKTTKK